MMKQEKSVAINIRNLTEQERKSFKVWCAEKGLTMQEALHRLMELAIKHDLDLTGG